MHRPCLHETPAKDGDRQHSTCVWSHIQTQVIITLFPWENLLAGYFLSKLLLTILTSFIKNASACLHTWTHIHTHTSPAHSARAFYLYFLKRGLLPSVANNIMLKLLQNSELIQRLWTSLEFEPTWWWATALTLEPRNLRCAEWSQRGGRGRPSLPGTLTFVRCSPLSDRLRPRKHSLSHHRMTAFLVEGIIFKCQ